ncbi:MAG: GTP cyclohydrolase II, partial [Myxococcota bacterium]
MTEMQSQISFEQAILVLGRRRFESVHGRFDVHFFRDQAQDRTAMAIACGDLRDRAPLLARVHSSCVTSECLMARDCDCADQLDGALATIAAAGRGVVFYLIQEGRGAGLTAKARDRMIVQASRHRLSTFDAYTEMGLPSDLRRYDSVGPMARALGIRAPLTLLTNNPEKAEALAVAFSNQKIDVNETLPLRAPSSPFNRDYLRAKRRSGHA